MALIQPYAALLRTPHALAPVTAAFLGRLPTGMMPLALVLFGYGASGSYATAGRITAAYTLCSALFAPVQGRLVDRFGQTWPLVVSGLAHSAALLGLLIAAANGAGNALLTALAGLAGLAYPPVSACMRALWSELLEGEDQRQTAYAFESVVIEISFFAGPLLVGLLAAAGSPSGAVLVAATLAGGGALGFAASRPSRRWRSEQVDGAVRNFLGPLVSPGMRTILIVSIPIGASFGVMDVTMPAFAEAEGIPAAAGVLIAAISVGSIPGGLWYGARRFSMPLSRQWAPFLGLTAVGLASLALPATIPQMAVLLALMGFTIAPGVTCALLLVDRVAPAGTRTEAFTWWNTAIVGGLAGGNYFAGIMTERVGVDTALLASSAAAAGAAALAVLLRRSYEV